MVKLLSSRHPNHHIRITKAAKAIKPVSTQGGVVKDEEKEGGRQTKLISSTRRLKYMLASFGNKGMDASTPGQARQN